MTLYVFDKPHPTNNTPNLLDQQTQQHLKKLHQKGLIKTIPHKSTTTLKTINTTTYTGLTQQTQRTHHNIPLHLIRFITALLCVV